MKNKNVLIIGGAGFIGCHLCVSLLNDGFNVVVVDNLMRGKKENISDLLTSNHFFFYKFDVTKTKKLISIIKKHDISRIYHLAANSDIQASALDPTIEYTCTFSTTWSVLFAMRETGVKELFFASTSAVYGEKNEDLKEDTTLLDPISYYGSCKMASEAIIKSFSHMNGFSSLIFRFPNVIGTKLTHGVIYDFVRKLSKDSTKLEVLGNGTQKKPYIFVNDLIDAIRLFDGSFGPGFDIFNIGLETASTVKFIAEEVVKRMSPQAKIIYGNGNIGWKGDVPHFSYNLEKIHNRGWKAKHTSDESVILSIEWAIDNYSKSKA